MAIRRISANAVIVGAGKRSAPRSGGSSRSEPKPKRSKRDPFDRADMKAAILAYGRMSPAAKRARSEKIAKEIEADGARRRASYIQQLRENARKGR